jgi:transcriptional regulator with XRE-family HTH domain
MKRFGEKLRILRQRRGLTLMQLAELLDVHYTHLGKIEIGKKRPSTDLVLRVADLFNVTTDQLMRDELEVE